MLVQSVSMGLTTGDSVDWVSKTLSLGNDTARSKRLGENMGVPTGVSTDSPAPITVVVSSDAGMTSIALPMLSTVLLGISLFEMF